MSKKLLLSAVVPAAILAAGAAHATNGYQLMGVGAYQKSLGGAVTANPGSAMTAITNPAGMTRVGNRTDFSIEMFAPDRYVDFRATGGDKQRSDVDVYGVPALGWVAPVSEGSKFVFGGGIYGTSGLGVDYPQTKAFSPGPGGADVYWDGYSSIGFWQMAPSLAWEVNDQLSLGASLDMDYMQVGFTQRMISGGQTIFNFDLGQSNSQFGFGLGLGALYDVNDAFTLGFSYKSKQNFSDFEYNLAAGDIQVPQAGAFPGGKYKLDLDFPQQAAIGIAWDATEAFTVSADIKWIEWSDTMGKLAVKGPSGYSMPMDPGWDDQIVYAIGVAWALNDRTNLRAGYNYAESPIDSSTVSNNLILPGVVESHWAIGGDYALNNNWDIGFHYMYVPEVSMQAPMTDPNFPGAEIGMDQSSFGINIGYRF